jgi:hypothetical protein
MKKHFWRPEGSQAELVPTYLRQSADGEASIRPQSKDQRSRGYARQNPPAGEIWHDGRLTASPEPPVITKGWDPLLRIAASVKSGWVSATYIIDRFASASRGDVAADAGDALGKLLRTLYLCDYLGNPSFQTQILNVLNQGEFYRRPGNLVQKMAQNAVNLMRTRARGSPSRPG